MRGPGGDRRRPGGGAGGPGTGGPAGRNRRCPGPHRRGPAGHGRPGRGAGRPAGGVAGPVPARRHAGQHRRGPAPARLHAPATRWLPLLDHARPQDRDGVSQGCDGTLAALRVEVSAGGSVVLVRRGGQPWSEAELESAHALHRLLAERHAGLYRAKAEQALFRLANFDPVTDLPNRAALLAEAQRSLLAGHPTAVLVVGLDRFRALKGTLGEAMADQLLAGVGQRLAGCVQPGDRLARVDTGAFAVLLSGDRASPGPGGGADTLVQAVREGLRAPFPLGGREIYVTASLGLVPAAAGQGDAAGLLRDAEIAAAEAEAGGGGSRAFDAAMRDRLTERYELYDRLRHGIYFGDAVRPVFQPIVNLEDGQLVGFEALARWTDAEKGAVPPTSFIPVAEETGLVVPLGNQILLQACRQVVRWNRGRQGKPLFVSVNLSPYQLDPDRLDLVRWVSGVLALTGADPSWLRLELTESGLVTHAGTAIEVLQNLRDLGVGLAIDDFGTGYSSLAYLQRLPIDGIKIDRSFVANLDDGAKGLALVRTIVQLARTMGLGVVAEGVETGRHLEVLRALGCGRGQGYLFARPLETADAARLVQGGAAWDGKAWG
ncbi:GGDEF domain-containing protein [Aerophototrophica crusticola]|uniref:GGDEF domain-containing protein n=1 Tax=Aerophototrophica crusticola TaxID=1709002 RepID=A0A858RBB2_9PROT|nr:GGDEF domain-containing protein [Rhodospirillaceae bacterium B3]